MTERSHVRRSHTAQINSMRRAQLAWTHALNA